MRITDPETVSRLILLKSACEELTLLNRTVFHSLSLATVKNSLPCGPSGQHERRVPSTWGARRDTYFWDSWDWSVRGEDDLRQFFQIARQIGDQLDVLEETEAADLLPGSVEEMIVRRSDLYLPDCWLLVVHHLGWTDQLPYECKTEWKAGRSFADEPFSMTSRLPVNVVQASIDALTVLLDATNSAVCDSQSGVCATARPSDSGKLSGCIHEFCQREEEQDRRQSLETTHQAAGAGETLQGIYNSSPRRRVDRRHVRKRADRTANMDALRKELITHILAARSHARAAIDHGRQPELLPRPSRRELAARIGITESAASRCFRDPAATELNLLWDTAGDLQTVLDFVRS